MAISYLGNRYLLCADRWSCSFIVSVDCSGVLLIVIEVSGSALGSEDPPSPPTSDLHMVSDPGYELNLVACCSGSARFC